MTLNRRPVTPILQMDSEIRFVSPAQDNGIAVLRVRNNAGTGYGEFLYAPPRLEELPPGYITTVAGAGRFAGDGQPATQAQIEPDGLVIDRNGNIYIAEASLYSTVRGIYTRLVGSV